MSTAGATATLTSSPFVARRPRAPRGGRRAVRPCGGVAAGGVPGGGPRPRPQLLPRLRRLPRRPRRPARNPSYPRPLLLIVTCKLQHFGGSTGYGHDDAGGREALDSVFAHVVGAEAAIVRPQAVELGNRERLIAFCEVVQQTCPVGSFIKPTAGETPGYASEVIFADGTFMEGSTSELSCDGPLRDPYAVFCQGGTHWTQWALVLGEVLKVI